MLNIQFVFVDCFIHFGARSFSLYIQILPSSGMITTIFSPCTQFHIPAGRGGREQELRHDLTYTTNSQLSFTASRYDKEITFRCEAKNSVMEEESEKPLHDSALLQVMCKLDTDDNV